MTEAFEEPKTDFYIFMVSGEVHKGQLLSRWFHPFENLLRRGLVTERQMMERALDKWSDCRKERQRISFDEAVEFAVELFLAEQPCEELDELLHFNPEASAVRWSMAREEMMKLIWGRQQKAILAEEAKEERIREELRRKNAIPLGRPIQWNDFAPKTKRDTES